MYTVEPLSDQDTIGKNSEVSSFQSLYTNVTFETDESVLFMEVSSIQRLLSIQM